MQLCLHAVACLSLEPGVPPKCKYHCPMPSPMEEAFNLPWVHLKPGFQLPSLWGICASEDLATLHMDHLHREVTHLAGLIQRLKENDCHEPRLPNSHPATQMQRSPGRDWSEPQHQKTRGEDETQHAHHSTKVKRTKARYFLYPRIRIKMLGLSLSYLVFFF